MKTKIVFKTTKKQLWIQQNKWNEINRYDWWFVYIEWVFSDFSFDEFTEFWWCCVSITCALTWDGGTSISRWLFYRIKAKVIYLFLDTSVYSFIFLAQPNSWSSWVLNSLWEILNENSQIAYQLPEQMNGRKFHSIWIQQKIILRKTSTWRAITFKHKFNLIASSDNSTIYWIVRECG